MQKLNLLKLFLALVVVVIIGSIIFSSTQKALDDAKEAKTKSQIGQLEQVLDSEVKLKVNLENYLDSCNQPGSWCQVNNDFVNSVLLDQSNPPIPLLPGELKDGTGNIINVQATGKDSYLIMGRAANKSNLCWIGSSDPLGANLSSDEPSACPN